LAWLWLLLPLSWSSSPSLLSSSSALSLPLSTPLLQ
jgi:hypothetical protein